jgi:glycosyltransferase involved in cell wall biosynthesis
MQVLHVITGLGQGGAEGALSRLVLASRDRCRHTVVSLTDEGVYGAELRAGGIEVHALRWRKAIVSPTGLLTLLQLMRKIRPDVVQTWMYHADLIGGLAARLARVGPVVWGIRNSELHPARSSRTTRIVARCCALLSTVIPRVIVSCSEKAARLHIAMGYRASAFRVIANGFDVARWTPDSQAAARLRRQWSVEAGTAVIGMVARWHPDKNHAHLLEALAMLVPKMHALVCVLVGPGMDSNNLELVRLIESRQMERHVLLLGPREDVVDVMGALDLHVLSSLAEAFPNVVAEAMACGTPCVVTDVGDAALIVGDAGWIVPVADAKELAASIESALGLLNGPEKDVLIAACRKRIEDNFEMSHMVRAYVELWMRVSAGGD